MDGETVEGVEFAGLATGRQVVFKDGRDRMVRMSLRALLISGRAELIHDRSGRRPPMAGTLRPRC